TAYPLPPGCGSIASSIAIATTIEETALPMPDHSIPSGRKNPGDHSPRLSSEFLQASPCVPQPCDASLMRAVRALSPSPGIEAYHHWRKIAISRLAKGERGNPHGGVERCRNGRMERSLAEPTARGTGHGFRDGHLGI